ncbi:MAG: 2,3-bisphosphoglycerate-independent phosphoglycerate mutase [Planctomycetes bacterium]|nr:2,3-bisphosphoglycerate-independent phosphoglycerate mutase [Planctomycetota bacterium]
MKYAIIIPDGAVDEPLDELDERTPLEAAELPTLDHLARLGRVGTAVTMPVESAADETAALLSVLGYDPREYPAGAGALEALARRLRFGPQDQVFRCNLVTITDGCMRDITAGHIGTPEAQPLIADLNAAFEGEQLRLHACGSYRNLLVWRDVGLLPKLRTTPPLEILDQPIRKHMPRGRGAAALCSLIQLSLNLLAEHDVNIVRRDLGENPASALWPHGHGPLPVLPDFHRRYGLRGALVAALDVLRGIGRLIAWDVLNVPGATGLLDTDYSAKGRAAASALSDHDLVCVHVQAPAEAGQQGSAANKVRSLEAIDREVVAPVLRRLEEEASWRILVMPSRPVPVSRTLHRAAPTIFTMAGTGVESNRGATFDETTAAVGELHLDRASDLMEYFLHR